MDILSSKIMLELWYTGLFLDSADVIEVKVGYDVRDIESMKTLIDHHCRGTDKPYGFRRFYYEGNKKTYLDQGTLYLGGKLYSFREISELAEKNKEEIYKTVYKNMKDRHGDYTVYGRDKRWHDYDPKVDKII